MSGGGGEKTEQPTARKKSQARKEGRIARTQDLGAWSAVLVAAIMFQLGTRAAMSQVQALLTQALTLIADPQVPAALALLGRGGRTIVVVALPFAVVMMLVGIVATGVQGGIHAATKNLKPTFKRLNPISGFKRIAGPHAAWEAAKSIVKSVVVGYVLWRTISRVGPVLVGASAMPLVDSVAYVADAALDLIRNAAIAGLIMGAADYAYQYKKTSKQLKMTLQEVKDENKQSEGDPHVKGQIRSRQLAMSRNRMMSSIAEADVLLVNPTHVAVALRYDPARGAPRVVAKGAGAVAARMRAQAEEHRVPMIADVPLARALHRACDIGQEVPPELYAAVAKVLAFVLSLKARGSAAGLHRVVPLPRARPVRATPGR